MTKTILFTIIPAALMLIITVSMPFYRVKLMNEAGTKRLALAKKRAFLSYFTSGIALLLLLLAMKQDFGKFNFVIPYGAVLALYVSIRESTLYPINGVYENLIIVGSEILRYKDIEKILSAEETTHPDYVLIIKPKNKDKPRQLIFDNANETTKIKKLLEEKMNV